MGSRNTKQIDEEHFTQPQPNPIIPKLDLFEKQFVATDIRPEHLPDPDTFFLESLAIKHCKCSNWPELLQQLTKFPNLIVLKLLVCRLCTSDLVKLPNIPLLSIYLSDNHVMDEGASFLSNFKTLSTIYLDNNSITSEGVADIVKLNLQVLNLSFNKIGKEGCKLLKKLRNLKSLYLSWNCLDEGAVHQISRINSLQLLDIAHNKIRCEGVFALSRLTNLKELFSSNNQIGNQGARYFNHFSKLTDLCVAYNQIETIECHFFKVKALRIHNNQGAKKLKKTVKTKIQKDSYGRWQ